VFKKNPTAHYEQPASTGYKTMVWQVLFKQFNDEELQA